MQQVERLAAFAKVWEILIIELSFQAWKVRNKEKTKEIIHSGNLTRYLFQ